jgi:AcrR family transcriptional regulator
LTGHGGGDTALTQQLREAVRAEIDHPAIDYDDDRMRGHVLVEDFMEHHQLQWNRHSDNLDNDADERRSREQLRALLWAGLRVLATLTHDLTDHAPSPWLWLADLENDDLSPAAGVFAELDDERLTVAAEDDDEELADAAEAHVLVHAALLHPDLLDSPAFSEPGSRSSW